MFVKVGKSQLRVLVKDSEIALSILVFALPVLYETNRFHVTWNEIDLNRWNTDKMEMWSSHKGIRAPNYRVYLYPWQEWDVKWSWFEPRQYWTILPYAQYKTSACSYVFCILLWIDMRGILLKATSTQAAYRKPSETSWEKEAEKEDWRWVCLGSLFRNNWQTIERCLGKRGDRGGICPPWSDVTWKNIYMNKIVFIADTYSKYRISYLT